MPLNPKSVTPRGNRQDAPLWRKEFPIDTDEEVSRSRREFLGGVTAAGGAITCGQMALNYLDPRTRKPRKETKHTPVTLEKKLPEMDVGEALVFHFPDEKSPCLFVKLGDNEFVAFSQKCTHLACPVIPDHDTQQLHCPCHHGAFDIRTGNPLSGPPRDALPRVRVIASADGTLTACDFHFVDVG